ncbi:MAG: CvpA family protein [Segetibacter sp.]|nr:CvpA family protein [Segetibacter sp.]
MAVFKGYSRGLIVAIFSFFAFIIGLAAALKLSASVADYLRTKTDSDSYWLPILSFFLVFIAVLFIVKWGAALIKKAVSLVLLGWVDALGGIILYSLLYLMIYSVVLFYATKIGLVSIDTQQASKTYPFIAALAPTAIDGLGKIFPFFSDMFTQLTTFFDKAGNKGQ